MSETATPSKKPKPPAPSRTAFKTLSVWLPKEAAAAARAVSRHGRDIENATLHLLNSAFGSYYWDKKIQASRIKPEAARPPGSADALRAFATGIASLNAERTKNAALPVKAGEKAKKLTLIPELKETVDNTARIFLDLTLLERVVKALPDGLDALRRPAFSRLPQALARASVKRARQNWLNHLASIKAWGQNAGGAGRPCPPGYLRKGERPPIDIAVVQGVLPALSKKAGTLFSDEKKTILLTDQEIAAWDGVELGKLTAEALRSRWGSDPQGKKRQGGKGKRLASWLAAPDISQVRSQRILIEGKRARLQIIVEVDANPPLGSFHAKLAELYPEKWARMSVSGNEKPFNAWVRGIASVQDWLVSSQSATATPIPTPIAATRSEPAVSKTKPSNEPADAMPAGFGVMGVDLGVANIAAMAFSNGSKGIVLTGLAIEESLGDSDLALDGFASSLTTPEHKALDARRSAAEAAGLPFPKADARRHKELSTELYQNPLMLAKREARGRTVKDFAHQTAATIAKIAFSKRAAFVIVGRNVGWKQEIELGREQNRRFHRIPHGLIIALLREKLAQLGISLIETEESWTSKASFADHHPLSRPPEPQEETPAGEAETPGEDRPLPPQIAALLAAPKAFLREAGKRERAIARAELARREEESEESKRKMILKGAKPARAARRGKGRGRHWLFRQGPWPDAANGGESSRRKVHADVNGAYNMIRKVCPLFRWHEGLSLKHELWGLSKARGYRPLADMSSAKARV